MISINKCVWKIVSDNPFLEDSLYNDYLNLTWFAEFIKPRVEQMTKKEVSTWSIKIALSRIAKDIQKNTKNKKIKVDNLFIRKDLSIITLDNSEKSNYLVREIQALKSWTDKNYFWVIQWINETDIIYSNNLKPWVEKIIKKANHKLKIENLWAIWIHLDKSMIDDIWIIYTLTKKLAFYKINVINIISTYTEIVFILDKRDIKKAFDVILV